MGHEVHVAQVVVGGVEPQRRWLPGYRFVGYLSEGAEVLVRRVGGVFGGEVVRFAAADVRGAGDGEPHEGAPWPW